MVYFRLKINHNRHLEKKRVFMASLHLLVTEIREETPLVRRIVLNSPDGSPLPAFTPGSTITLDIPAIGQRKYSLVNYVASQETLTHPASYMLGVRLSQDGQGGSRYIHALAVGDTITASQPHNDFALDDSGAPVLLIAGGIGVTPLLSKAATMKATGRPFRFVYAARSADDFAFLDEIKALVGDRLVLHDDARQGGVLDLKALFDTVAVDERVHICGPRPMLHAAKQEAKRREWPPEKLRFELFYSLATPAPPPAPPAPIDPTPTEVAADGSFEIEIKSTGAVFTVPPDRSIVDVLSEAGLDPLFDCNKGECGVCQVGVLAGEPDHKDFILSESERAENKLIQICVSRAKSARLVLDL
jgi:ferredoxin-NADP reductase